MRVRRFLHGTSNAMYLARDPVLAKHLPEVDRSLRFGLSGSSLPTLFRHQKSGGGGGGGGLKLCLLPTSHSSIVSVLLSFVMILLINKVQICLFV